MSRNGARLSVLGVALLLITGCGGSSGGGAGSGGSGGGNGGGTGGGSGDQATTITFSLISGTPAEVAVKVGSGNYTAENLTSGKLTISVPSGTTTYSVAYLCPPFQQEVNDTLELEFIQFESVQDGTTVNGQCPGQVNSTAPPMGNLTGTLDASAFLAPLIMDIAISAPGYTPVAQGKPASNSFQASGPVGPDRVTIGLYDSSDGSLLAIKNFNNQAVPGVLNGGNTVTFGSSDATTMQPVTFVNLPTGFSTPSTTALAAVGGNFTLSMSPGTTAQYPQFPAGVMQSGDYYSFEASSSLTSGAQTSTVGSFLYPTSGGPVTLSFPAPWSTAGPAPASRPTFIFDYTGYAGKSGVLAEGSFTWTPTSGPQDEILATATQNYLGSATSLAVPDLSGVNGFVTPPASGTSILWTELIFQGTFPSTSSPAGGAETYVNTAGTYTVP
jgi:hypothetical protein